MQECINDILLYDVTLCRAYISRLTPKSRMIYRLTPKSCLMYAGLRLAKRLSFVVQTNSTNVWPIRKLNLSDVCCQCTRVQKHLLCSLRANSTFVVASSQSQRIAFMMRSARIAALKLLMCSGTSVRTSKTFVAQCMRYLNINFVFCCCCIAIKKLVLANVR